MEFIFRYEILLSIPLTLLVIKVAVETAGPAVIRPPVTFFGSMSPDDVKMSPV